MIGLDLVRALGTVPTWLAVVALVVIGYYVVRGSGGQALAILRTSNEVLSRRVDELDRQHRSDAQIIANLEARTSLEPMVAAVVDQFERHEERAAERHAALLALIAALTERMGRP